jgi:hypothetical protein
MAGSARYEGRAYRVVVRGADFNARWLLTLLATRFGSRFVEPPLPAAVVDRTRGGFSIASRSGKGGLAVGSHVR